MRVILLSICLFLLSCETNQHQLVVKAGDADRRHSVILFTLPDDASRASGPWELIDRESGAIIPVQSVQEGEGVFLLDQPLAAGSERSYVLRPAKEAPARVQAIETERDLQLKAGEKDLLAYNVAVDCPPAGLPDYYCRSGYIHPLRSPGGAVVTDDFPAGHTHQHGLFFAWVNTTFRGDFTDFWNQQNETGTGAHKTLSGTTSGPVFAGFTAELQQISLKHGPVLDEKWQLTAYDLGDYYVLDLVSTQQNITSDTLHINQYHYGGLGIRGARAWNEVDTLSFRSNAQFLTSEGKTRVEANHSRPRWTAMYGETDQGVAGVAVFDHPDNFRHPQPVRVHPTMPYFCLAPMVKAAMPVAPNATYRSRYRIVTFDGEPKNEELEAMWRDYASPAAVSLPQ